MAPVSLNKEALEAYKPVGNFSFFNLKDDGDQMLVRFLYNEASEEELNIQSTHKIKTSTGKEIYVSCLREYGDTVDKCPLCGQSKPNLQVWIPMLPADNSDPNADMTPLIWNRGYAFIADVFVPVMEEAAATAQQTGKPVCSQIYLITRHGAAGNSKTTYTVELHDMDDFTMDDLPEDFELPDVKDKLFFEKTYEELSNYVQTGYFTSGDDNKAGGVQPRRGANTETRSIADIMKGAQNGGGIARRGNRPL